MEAIKTIDLTKKYADVTAVDKLNLTVDEGELFALLGVNGAGKTTTIKMLCTLIKPSSGQGYLLGNDIVNETKKVKEIIAVSPQETAVGLNLTVKENLLMMCSLHGFSKEKTNEKIKEMLETFELNKVVDKKAAKLSGGWQRKLSIAMALVSQPQILFLDEPTLGLDVLARNDLWDTIKKLKKKITIVLTTHYLIEAEKLADRIAIMKEGRIVALGTVEQLKKKAGTNDFEEAFIALIKEQQNENDDIRS